MMDQTLRRALFAIFLLSLLLTTARNGVKAQVSPPATAATEKAVLDRYCVTCHNDRAKVANFSIQKLDISKVGEQPESWEKIVRKLRAGMMPPPGIRRPTPEEYDGLRDWLEGEIDRKAHSNPGSVVLHRLN